MSKLFSYEEIEKSKIKLCKFLPDKDIKNGVLFQPFCNTTVTKDFYRKALKRVNVVGTFFLDCNFSGVAATGSKFSNTKFQNCNFTGSNFQYCSFNKVRFCKSSSIKGANFSHSVFTNCDFSEITIIESTFYDSYFENCTFSKSVIKTDTLENTTMCNCYIEDIDLAHLNLEYMQFNTVKMNNVVLPPYQIPYIIGAPSYLKNTEEKVYVYTDNGNITIKEYSHLYNDLIVYFYNERNFFPIANILIATGKDNEAFEYIKQGIEEASDYFDFRMIKHYCRLACSNNNFTHEQLKYLYTLITNLSYNDIWDINTLHSYMLNIGEIKEILLNNYEKKHRVEFIIKTSIDKDDLNSINLLYNQINAVINENCSSDHIDSIELRHNSPYELYVTCIDMLPHIMMFVSAMYGIFSVGNKGLAFLKNVEETIRIHQQNQLHKYEIEEKLINIEIKKEELKKARSNIVVTSVSELEHILKCNSIDIAKKITPEYLHYKVSNTPE